MERLRSLLRELTLTSWAARNYRRIAILAVVAIAVGSARALIKGPEQAILVPVAVIALLSVTALIVIVLRWTLK